MLNNRNLRKTLGFSSLEPLLRWRRRFRRVAETSFCKGEPHELSAPPSFCYRPNFNLWTSPANRVPNNRINAKQDLLASTLCRDDQGNFEELQKACFAKEKPHEPCGSTFAIRRNFQVWISPANRVPTNRNQRQTAAFVSLWPLLTRSGKFRRVAETAFCKVITGASYYISSSTVLREFNWQPLVNRREQKKVKVTFKIRNNKLSECMANMFNVTDNINYNVRSNKVDFALPKPNTNFMK